MRRAPARLRSPVFPRDTRRHLYVNGGIETALGLGLAARQTRLFAVVGLIGYAERYCVAHDIVIGHLNHPPVTTVYHDLIDLIHACNLRTVSLGDVFLKPEVTRLTSAYPS